MELDILRNESRPTIRAYCVFATFDNGVKPTTRASHALVNVLRHDSSRNGLCRPQSCQLAQHARDEPGFHTFLRGEVLQSTHTPVLKHYLKAASVASINDAVFALGGEYNLYPLLGAQILEIVPISLRTWESAEVTYTQGRFGSCEGGA